MAKRVSGAIAIGMLALLAGARARAQETAAPFGERHQLVLSAERLFGYTHRSGLGLVGDETDVSLFGDPAGAGTTPRLAFDAFVVGRLSLGAAAGFAKRSYSNTAPIVTVADDTWIVFEPRVGYAVSLGRRLDLWPRLGFTYAHLSESARGFSATDATYTLTIDVPLVFVVASHFFIDVAPTIDLGLARTHTAEVTSPTISSNPLPIETDLGLQCALGGFF